MRDEDRALFHWDGERLLDSRFWCEPRLVTEAIDAIPTLDFPSFDGLATFEARGFFLAGIAAHRLNLPVVLMRKHKPFFDRMNHASHDFTNWKGEPEKLTVLRDSLPSVRRVLIVDDILDTGRSLRAGQELLGKLGIEIVGAYYLLNAQRDPGIDFGFPVHARARHRLL